MIYTYQDLLAVGDDERKKMQFVQDIISRHQNSDEYQTALTAEEYARHRNTTIVKFQKLLYTVTGKVVPDNFNANYKLASGFFDRFVIQQTQFLLGNGVSWTNDDTSDRLSNSRYDFNSQLQKVGKLSLIEGVAFGFWNLDHIEIFALTEFAPLFDEEDGSLKAGVRFWRIDKSKPLRATLYELDGYTEIIYRNDEEYEILQKKTPYKITYAQTNADGAEIYDGQNYPTFPIVPLWGNPHHQSELVGLQEQIDCYDLIKSGFANDVDDASQIYWIIQNAGGMNDLDLTKFVERIKTVKATVIEDDGAKAEAHTIDVPYASSEALLSRIEKDLYKDYMALDVDSIAGGAITATQIKAAYEPLNNKADQFEFCVIEFVNGILDLAGIDDEPNFTRSLIVNVQENIQTLLQASEYLSSEYVTQKILEYMGDTDKTQEILKQIQDEEAEMNGYGEAENIDNTSEEV